MEAVLGENDSEIVYFCALTAKPLRHAEAERKAQSDYFDLAKALQRILLACRREVKCDPAYTKDMKVIGFLEHGYKLRVLTVQSEGHICVVRSDTTRRYPTNLDQLPDLIDLLKTLVGVRQEIRRLKRLIDEGRRYGQSHKEIIPTSGTPDGKGRPKKSR